MLKSIGLDKVPHFVLCIQLLAWHAIVDVSLCFIGENVTC